MKHEFGAISWVVGLYVGWNSNSTGSCFASYSFFFFFFLLLLELATKVDTGRNSAILRVCVPWTTAGLRWPTATILPFKFSTATEILTCCWASEEGNPETCNAQQVWMVEDIFGEFFWCALASLWEDVSVRPSVRRSYTSWLSEKSY